MATDERDGERRKADHSDPAAEIEREISYHLERRADELIASGVARDEARRQARREFGDIEDTRAYCTRMSQRARRRAALRRALADLGQDLRFALRGMRRSPGFTLVATIILALGIGATTAVFSIVNAVVLQPLDYPEPAQLLQLWETNRQVGTLQDPVSPVDLRDWQEQSTTLQEIAGFAYQAMSLSGEGRPERLVALETSANFFELFDAPAALGRTFAANEEGPEHRVAVLSDALWRGRFGADPDIAGRAITINGVPYLVIGVMPSRFAFPNGVQLWVPFTFNVAQLSRGQHFLYAVARMADGATRREAQAEMGAIAARIEEEYPQYAANQGVNLVPLQQQLVGGSAPALWVVFAAVALVLLIACGNVGNMLLVRSSGRAAEISIRKALGAGRWRLTRQLLVEGVALSLIAGLLGVLVTSWGIRALVAALPFNLPRAAEIAVDPAVLGFALAVSSITGIAFGLGPALHAAGADRVTAAVARGRVTAGRTTGWLRDGLVVAEVALTLVVLVTAGLLMANLTQLRAVDPGFRADGVLTARLSLPPDRYPGPEERVQFVRRLIEEVEGLPGVASFGTVDSLPFSGSRSTSSFDIESEDGDPETPRTADRREITSGYFETMGIPLLRGRDVTPADVAAGAPVVVVNEAFARRFFPEQEALGRRIQVGGREEVELYGEAIWREIVGVVGNLVHDDLTAEPGPEMYMPFDQHPSTRLALAVRTRGEPADFIDTLRDAVLRVDADQPIYGVLPMSARLDNFLAMARANAWTLGAFAAVALLLSVLGIYSVVSYTVSQRVHELGVRIAVGASGADVVRLVLRQGAVPVAVGLGLGLTGTFLIDRLVRALLFRVEVFDPLLLATPVALLAGAALLACLAPARRALRIDPIEALRKD